MMDWWFAADTLGRCLLSYYFYLLLNFNKSMQCFKGSMWSAMERRQGSLYLIIGNVSLEHSDSADLITNCSTNGGGTARGEASQNSCVVEACFLESSLLGGWFCC